MSDPKTRCEEQEQHPTLQEYAKKNLPSVQTAMELSRLFKVFGDFSRINLLCALSQGDLCVCDLAEVLQMTPSAVSHQLGLLRQNRLVKVRREGKNIFYSPDDDHIQAILSAGLEHVHESLADARVF